MKKSYTLKELADLTGSSFQGDPESSFSGYDELKTATDTDVSFLSNMRYKEQMLKSSAGVFCVENINDLPEDKNYLICKNPSETFQNIINLFLDRAANLSAFHGIHPTAIIHPNTLIEENVEIGPYVVIDQNCVIKSGTVIKSHTSIGPNVQIGNDCLIHSSVNIREGCIIKNRVILQPGAVIGSCGFGYHTTHERKHLKIEQIGLVTLEDDVEVGANTTIDRARFKSTTIKKGTKIDNLVQIGHNVELGNHNIIVAQSGLAGSTITGDHVTIGGQCGVLGHLKIAENTLIATRSGIGKSIEKSGVYGGNPVLPINEHNRLQVLYRNLDVLNKKIKNIESMLNELNNPVKT